MITVVFPGSSAVEQVAVNHLVAGSIPARGAIFFSINNPNAHARHNQ